MVLAIKDCEKVRAEKKLLAKFQGAEETVAGETGWKNFDELKSAMEE